MSKVGRPTKLTDELLARARGYLSTYETAIPTIEGLALYLDISRESVYDWMNKDINPEFTDIVKRVQITQANELIDKGLTGKFNPSITKLILSGKHDYIEKTSKDITTAGKELPAPILGGISKSVPTDNSDQETRRT